MTTGDASGGAFDPREFIAQFEGHIREIEAAGGQAPEILKQQLERMKHLLAEGRGEGIGFMSGGDASSGLMGFSVPLEADDVPSDPEQGAT